MVWGRFFGHLTEDVFSQWMVGRLDGGKGADEESG